MAKSTQNYKLFEILKSGEVVTKEKIAELLEIKLISVPVYIHELKSQFKAKIESVREGRKVMGYKLDLDDADSITIPQYRRNNAELLSKKGSSANNIMGIGSSDGSVPVIDKDAEITRISEREFDDTLSSLSVDLGIDFDPSY